MHRMGWRAERGETRTKRNARRLRAARSSLEPISDRLRIGRRRSFARRCAHRRLAALALLVLLVMLLGLGRSFSRGAGALGSSTAARAGRGRGAAACITLGECRRSKSSGEERGGQYG